MTTMVATAETCDRCGGGVQARYRVTLLTGSTLTFCAHHGHEYNPGLVANGGTVVDLDTDLATA